MDSFLKEQQNEGLPDSSGSFTIDGKMARRKLAAFQCAQPGSYLLKFVQAAVAASAPSLSVTVGRDELVLSFPTQ